MAKEKRHAGKIKSLSESFKDAQAKDAQKAMIQELFNDLHRNRGEVYKMNFIRGLFFGLGSVLGGTVVISLIIWLLSFFVDFFVIGQFFENAQRTLELAQ